MTICLDEYDWAENALEQKTLGDRPTETLTRLSKYYLANKYDKKEIKHLLELFLVRCDPDVSVCTWADAINKAIRDASKHPLIKIDGINITWAEMETISRIQGKQIKRLAFTLLCIAKYWDAVSETNNHWVNCVDTEIMKMANIGTSIKRQCLLFAELRDLGFIKYSKKISSLNVQVLTIDDDSPTAVTITDFRNLGYQYLMMQGEPFFVCQGCGIVTKIKSPDKGRKPKYCNSCAASVWTQQRVNAVMRSRETALN